MSKTSQARALNTSLPRSSRLAASQLWANLGSAPGTVAQGTVVTSEILPAGPNAAVNDAAANVVAIAAPHDVGLQSTGSYVEGSSFVLAYNGATDVVALSGVFRVDTTGAAVDVFSAVDWTQGNPSPVWAIADGAGTLSVHANRFHSSAVQVDVSYTQGTVHHLVVKVDYAAELVTVRIDGTESTAAFTRSGAAQATPALVPIWAVPGLTSISANLYGDLSAAEILEEEASPYAIAGDVAATDIDLDIGGLNLGASVSGVDVALGADLALDVGGLALGASASGVDVATAADINLAIGRLELGGSVAGLDAALDAAVAVDVGGLGLGASFSGLDVEAEAGVDLDIALAGVDLGASLGGLDVANAAVALSSRPLINPVGTHAYFVGYGLGEGARYANCFSNAVQIAPGEWLADVPVGLNDSVNVSMVLTWTNGTPQGSVSVAASVNTTVSNVVASAGQITFDVTIGDIRASPYVYISGLASHAGMDLRRSGLVGQNIVFDPRYAAAVAASPRLRLVHFMGTNDEDTTVADWLFTVLNAVSGRTYGIRDTETDTNIEYTAQPGDGTAEIVAGLVSQFTAAGRTATAISATEFSALANGENYYDAPAGLYVEYWRDSPGIPRLVTRTEWADRVLPNPGFVGYQPQASAEAIVREANALYTETGGAFRSIWVPHFLSWSDDYNTQFLNYLEANLLPQVEVDDQMGNELWNRGTPPFSKGAHVALATCFSSGFYSLDGTPPNEGIGDGIAQGERMAGCASSTIFSGNRTVRRHLGAFSGWRESTHAIIAGAVGQGYGQYFDAVALGPYTNGAAGASFDTGLTDAQMVDLIEIDQQGVVAEVVEIHDNKLGPLRAGTLADYTPGATGNLPSTDLAMSIYEFGIHYDVAASFSLTTQRTRVIRSAELGARLRPYYDQMFGLSEWLMACWFLHSGDENRWVFSSREHINSATYFPAPQAAIDAGNAAYAAAAPALEIQLGGMQLDASLSGADVELGAATDLNISLGGLALAASVSGVGVSVDADVSVSVGGLQVGASLSGADVGADTETAVNLGGLQLAASMAGADVANASPLQLDVGTLAASLALSGADIALGTDVGFTLGGLQLGGSVSGADVEAITGDVIDLGGMQADLALSGADVTVEPSLELGLPGLGLGAALEGLDVATGADLGVDLGGFLVGADLSAVDVGLGNGTEIELGSLGLALTLAAIDFVDTFSVESPIENTASEGGEGVRTLGIVSE